MQPTETVNTSSQRPGLGKTPRKSFMEPSIQGATSRQQKLDNAVLRHIADIFFTIHITGLQGTSVPQKSSPVWLTFFRPGIRQRGTDSYGSSHTLSVFEVNLMCCRILIFDSSI